MSNSKIVSACAALIRASYDLPDKTVEERNRCEDLRTLGADAREEYDALAAKLDITSVVLRVLCEAVESLPRGVVEADFVAAVAKARTVLT